MPTNDEINRKAKGSHGMNMARIMSDAVSSSNTSDDLEGSMRESLSKSDVLVYMYLRTFGDTRSEL